MSQLFLCVTSHRRRFAGAEHRLRVSQSLLNVQCDWVRGAQHTPRGPIQFLERRHTLAEIVERGAFVIAECIRVSPPHPEREITTLSKNATRYGHRFAQ